MKKMSPKTIGGDNEHSFIRRSILGAAKENGIPTFAIQHGDIHHNVFNYQFVKEDPLQKLLPDMTAVWSERTKKSLVDISGYKPESISVVGQIRTDIIPFLIKGIQSKKEQRVFTVLFASQPFSNQELRKRMYCDFNRAAQELQNFNFIHKPHPGETEWSFFDELDSELEFNIERTNADLYSTLGGVDAIVTGYSTVAIEALYFNDDVIVLDYYKEDLANYIKDQVALRAVNYQELVQAIRRLANGEELLDQNIRDAYIKERVCMIDGKTSMRLKEAIEAL